jgi:NADPH-dependent ferric siderophore reductase
MKTLRFEGFSDDTFGELTTRTDYDNCADGTPIIFLVAVPGGMSCAVYGMYCPDGATGWMIGVARHDEDDDTAMPAWPMRIEHSEREYSPRLVMEVPDEATVTLLRPEPEE